MRLKIYLLIVLVSLAATGCFDEVSSLEIDYTKKAVVLGDASRVKQLTIEGPGESVNYGYFLYLGKPFYLYFNKKNVDCQAIFVDSLSNNYIFKLKPNSEYIIRSYSKNGDRGPMSAAFKTDKDGNMVDGYNQ